MDFLIDECVLANTRRLLKELGFSAKPITELGKASASNGEVLNLAKQQEAILITNDLHFSNIWLYPLGSHTRIILIRQRASETTEDIERAHQVLIRLLKEVNLSELKGRLTIVDRNKYRIHKE